MNIALIAHDGKKKLMQNFCIAYRGILSKNELYATGTTGRLIEEVTNLNIHKYLAGHLGGEQQICFGNPFLTMPSDKDSPNKKEELWSLIEGAEPSRLAGTTFDLEGIEQNIDRLNVYFMEQCQDILFGSSKDLETELKTLSEEADALGLESVLEKWNQQLGGL